MKLKRPFFTISIASVVTILFSLYPFWGLFESAYNYNSGSNAISLERFRHSETFDAEVHEKPVFKSKSVIPFKDTVIYNELKYIYCFSTTKEFNRNNIGLFHIYRNDSSTFFITLMSPDLYGLDAKEFNIFLNKELDVFSSHERKLKREILEEIKIWSKLQ